MLTADQKKEIKAIVADEFNKHLDKALKPNGKAHKATVEKIVNSFEDLFKTLWQKRASWTRDIKGV